MGCLPGRACAAAVKGPAIAAVKQQSQHGRQQGAWRRTCRSYAHMRLLPAHADVAMLCSARGHFAGAKGFRKPVRATGTSESDDKKLSLALKKLGQCWLLRTVLSMPSGRPTRR